MKNNAIVEKIEDKYVIVSTFRKGACGDNCAMCNSCTAQKVFTKAFCDFDVNVGDSVIIESNSFSIVLALLAVFVIPIVVPLILYLFLCAFDKIVSLVAAFIGAIVAFLFIYKLSRLSLFLNKITPKIVLVTNKF